MKDIFIAAVWLSLIWHGSSAVAVPRSLVRQHERHSKGFNAQKRGLKQEKVPNDTASYEDNASLRVHLHDLAFRCSEVTTLHFIGKSTRGNEIPVIQMTKFPDRNLPKVKLVGNIHGNEPTGRYLCTQLAEWLCTNGKSGKAKEVLEKVDLFLIPTLNPDGFDMRKRENALGIDLNRNFPDRFSQPDMNLSGGEEIETQLLVNWTLHNGPFVSSMAFHEGALVANYPWDGTDDRKTRYEACPDDQTFKHLATMYATSHRKMSLSTNKEFPNGGTTNGAAWYPIYGSMQDWNYVRAKCMEITVEVSERKWPDEKGLPELFEDNKMSIINFILNSTYGGFYGIIYEADKNRKRKENIPLAAEVVISGINFTTVSNQRTGTFFRPLAPGTYTALISKKEYETENITFTIGQDNGFSQNFYLVRQHLAGFPQFGIAKQIELRTFLIYLAFSGPILACAHIIRGHKSFLRSTIQEFKRSVE